MKDPRIRKMAKQVIEYSVHLQPGEKVLIDIWDEAYDYAEELVGATQEAGGQPFVNLQSLSLNRQLIMNATEESMEAWYKYENFRMEDMDAYIVVRKNHNNKTYEGIPAEKMRLYNKYYGKLHYGTSITNSKGCVRR